MTTLTWNSATGGIYNTATLWTPNQIPTASDTVIFQVSTVVASTYTVTGDGVASEIEVIGDNVTATGTLTASSSSELALIDGSMTIAAGAALLQQTVGTGDIAVGNASLANANALLVVNGTVTAALLTIITPVNGANAAMTATVDVSGTGASFDTVTMHIDHGGTLDISAGATVSDTTGVVGNTTGPAYAVVTGPDSTWVNTINGLQIGSTNPAAAGTVTVTNYATVTSTGATLLIETGGALLLDDTATIIGTYELDGGLIEALPASGQTGSGTIAVGNAIELDGGTTSTLAATGLTGFDVTGRITGSGKLAVQGGSVELADGANSFSGGLTIGDEATVAIAASGAQGTGSITFATTSGDSLANAGTLSLLSGVTVGNALIVNGGTATLAIPFGGTYTLTNSVSGAGALALSGGSFTLATPSDEAQTGGLILQSGALILTNGEQGLGGPLSFGSFGGSSMVWDTVAAPSAATLTIGGFLGDSIVFPDLTFNGESINSGGTVTLTENGVAVGSLVLTGATGNLRAVQYTNGEDQTVSALTSDSAWAAPVSGSFGTASNWQYNAAPGSTDIAFFSLNSPTPYTVSGGGTAAAIDVQGDQVTLSGSYTLLGSPASESSFLPLQVGSDGSLTIAAGASVTAPSAAGQFATIGTGTGGGTLEVLGTLSVGALFADQGSTVIVDGSAADVTTARQFGDGYNGADELPPAGIFIENGATVTDGTGYVGFATGGTGLVTGAGSTWTSGAGGLTVGQNTSPTVSTLTVENGGTVSSAAAAIGLLAGATLAVSPTATIIGAITATGVSGHYSPVLEAIADPGQTGPAVTDVSNSVVINSGALVLAGSADATLDMLGKIAEEEGSFPIVVVGSVILADAANSIGGGITIGAPTIYPFGGDQGVLEEAATGALGTGVVTVESGGTMIFDSGVSITNSFTYFAVGDTFDLRDITYATGASATLTGNTLAVTSPGSSPVDITLYGEAAGTLFNASPDGLGGIDVTVACYCPDTLIRTPSGEVAIADLAIGDTVMTLSGQPKPIRWIGRRGYAPRFARRNPDLWPVVIRAGALAEGVPARDLMVSPAHAMYLDGVLIPASALVNGVSIVQPEPEGQVEYVHLELDAHDVIFAEGAASESFVDDDSRAMFHNAADYAARYPDAVRQPAWYCAPRVTEGFALAAVRRRIAVRAGMCSEPAAAPLRGFLDFAGADLVEGWAQDPRHPEAPVCLDLVVDGVTVAQTLANRYRSDLAAAALGSGRHAFSFRWPAPLAPRQLRTVQVRRSSDQAVLPCSEATRRAA